MVVLVLSPAGLSVNAPSVPAAMVKGLVPRGAVDQSLRSEGEGVFGAGVADDGELCGRSGSLQGGSGRGISRLDDGGIDAQCLVDEIFQISDGGRGCDGE